MNTNVRAPEPREELPEYRHEHAGFSTAHPYLVPAVLDELAALGGPERVRRLFELGCGSGAVAHLLAARGHAVTGVDPSASGIALAKRHYPSLNLHPGSAYDDLSTVYGRFPVVISLEVVEHVFAPRRYAATVHDLLEPGGTALISTPYHGYWKNLALAATGRLDDHFDALQDGGHVKFWSIRTLTALLEEAGFSAVRFRFAGRVRPFSKSMLAIATR
jgi:SAM-dependent methyltransferase